MPNTTDYKMKYLDLLDEHEQANKQQKTQVDLLKRAILNLSVAAKEQAPELDAAIENLQHNLKGGEGFKVYESIESLQKTVLSFDEKKNDDRKQVGDLTNDLMNNLLTLTLPKDIETKLRARKKALKNQQINNHAILTTLKEVHSLQAEALSHNGAKKTSLWNKLTNNSTLEPHSHNIDTDVTAIQPIPDSTATTPNAELELIEKTAQITKNRHDIECTATTKRIRTTLTELVHHIEPTDEIQQKIELVLSRLEGNMNYDTLAITLDDIRDILMARYLRSDNDFSYYLKSLNTELSSIGDTLGIAKQQGHEQTLIAQDLSHTVSSQVDFITESVNNHNDLPTIQKEVNANIATIRQSLKKFDEHQSSQEQNLTEQLESLLEQVKRIEEDAENSRKQLEEQRHKATHDTLTGLPNREAYNQRAFYELRRFARYKHPLTLAICDIDHFKRINDTIGHQAGDKVLRLVAQLIEKRLREVDFIARYGGEEFVIIMPETSGEQALEVLDQVRSAIEQMPLKFKQNPINISICFGIKEFNEDDTTETAFESADKALYQAKENGRNCCILSRS